MANIFSKLFSRIKSETETITKSSIVTDIDANNYKTIKIGTQEWTAENLNVEHYRNGDVIPEVQDREVWKKLKTGAWCYYDNDPANGNTYGKLYNWHAVNDPRGLAPAGWHIPSDREWTKLTDYLCGKKVDLLGGTEIGGGKLKATTLWDSPNEGIMNSSEFTAFPGGSRSSNGFFLNVGRYGLFWSASESNSYCALSRVLCYSSSGVRRFDYYEEYGLSVRCVRD